MEPAFWHDRWQRQDVGFHQKDGNELLAQYWGKLALAPGSSVFVPMCGKSRDMAWLAQQGHTVIGSELSELAVDAFLSQEKLVPAESYTGSFIVKRAAPYELWLGDHFSLPQYATRGISAIYDRAALVAMPRTMQQKYAAKLAELAPKGSKVLLIALDYDPSAMTGPPFPIPARQAVNLFGADFRIELLESRDRIDASPNLKERGLKALLESVFVMERR